MLLAMVYVLLAGLSLDLFVAASPLAVPHYSREAFPLYENDRHTLGRSLVSRMPQILTASDLGKRGLGTTEPRDVYNTLVRRYQDVLSSSLQLRACEWAVLTWVALNILHVRRVVPGFFRCGTHCR